MTTNSTSSNQLVAGPNNNSAAPTYQERNSMWLTVTTDDGSPSQIISVDSDEFVIGRDRTANLVLDDDKASRQHCRLERLPNGDLELVDLGSTNGTRLNGARVAGSIPLHGGEVIRIGRHQITVSRTEPGSGMGTVIDTTSSMIGAPGRPAPVMPAPSAPLPAPTAPYVAPEATVATNSKTKIIVGSVAALALLGGLVGVLASRGGNDGPKELTTQKIIDLAPRTVSVQADVDGQARGRGTGWVLDAKQGLIVTNQHVVNSGTTFTVGLSQDKRPATIVASAPCEDLVVLKVNDVAGLESMELSSQAEMKQGDKVVAVGYPGNPAPKPEIQANAGIVSVVKTEFTAKALDVPKFSNIVQTDAAINPGNSGGPLLDVYGRLVAVNSAGDSSKENQAYSIGVDKVKEVTGFLREGSSRGWMGFGLVFPRTEEDFTDLDLPVIPGGIIAEFAVPLTPGANIGLGRKSFVIVGINGSKLEGTLQSYCTTMANLKAGDSVKLNVTVDGENLLTIPMKLA
jgi:S1-C subfamily serine protease